MCCAAGGIEEGTMERRDGEHDRTVGTAGLWKSMELDEKGPI